MCVDETKCETMTKKIEKIKYKNKGENRERKVYNTDKIRKGFARVCVVVAYSHGGKKKELQ